MVQKSDEKWWEMDGLSMPQKNDGLPWQNGWFQKAMKSVWKIDGFKMVQKSDETCWEMDGMSMLQKMMDSHGKMDGFKKQ